MQTSPFYLGRLERAKKTVTLHTELFLLSAFLGVHGDIFSNQDDNSWYKDGVKLIQDNLKVKPNTDTAKSAILFLGDGLGITTITAARIYDGQLKGKTGEENVLSWEVFPWSALAKTYLVDLQGADSASCATAFLNGIKTNSGRLSSITRNYLSFCSFYKIAPIWTLNLLSETMAINSKLPDIRLWTDVQLPRRVKYGVVSLLRTSL